MKILETQAAVLSNYEVLAHVSSVREKSRSTPQTHQNVSTVFKEVTDYLSPTNSSASSASHYAQTPSPLPPYTPPFYSKATMNDLMRQLKPYTVSRSNPSGLYKNELLMIVNLRPQDLGLLDCVVEECDERFSEAHQLEILSIIREVLGGGDGEKNEAEGANGHAEEDRGKDGG